VKFWIFFFPFFFVFLRFYAFLRVFRPFFSEKKVVFFSLFGRFLAPNFYKALLPLVFLIF